MISKQLTTHLDNIDDLQCDDIDFSFNPTELQAFIPDEVVCSDYEEPSSDGDQDMTCVKEEIMDQEEDENKDMISTESTDADNNNVLKDQHYIKKHHRKIDLYINEKSVHVLQYIGGRICQKFGNKYPEIRGKSSSSFAWINVKSNGNLHHPSTMFLEKLKEIERKFRLFHGQTVDTDPNPNERLAEYILSECEIQKPILEYFIKCRLHHRLKTLNVKNIHLHRNVRSLKQLGQHQN